MSREGGHFLPNTLQIFWLTFYLFSRQRDNAINALSSFTTFYKRNSNGQERFRRQALEDLGAFTTFMKKADPKLSANNNKRSTRSISREDLRDALGTFSSFMDPYQYYKRVSVQDSLEPTVASSQAPPL